MALHSCLPFFVPRTWPCGLHQWASVLSSVQVGLASADPGRRCRPWAPSFRVAVGGRRLSHSSYCVNASPHPRLLELLLPLVPSGLGVGTHRAEMGWPTVLACLGLSQVFALSSCVPANLSVPGRLGQFLTLGRNTISCAFTVLCPHLAVLSFCYNFFK